MPPLARRRHLDTQLFGGSDPAPARRLARQLPVHIGGTNGDAAGFGGVNPVLDITDWYRRSARRRRQAHRLEVQGRVEAAHGRRRAVRGGVDPALGSVSSRTETWTRWTTFDGRWLTSIEGKTLAKKADAAQGDFVVDMMGDLIVPGDADHDGVVSAVSFDYVALDATRWPEALRQLGFAKDVDELREATKGYIGGALYTAGADRHGNILYASYQAIPCRGYLGTQGGTTVRVGTDPSMLLDGTVYGGFEIPSGEDGKVDEAPGKNDPYKCVVPWERMPRDPTPTSGFIFTANNDPGRLTDDGDPRERRVLPRRPWDSVRAHSSIRRGLQEITAQSGADVDAMTKLQADKTSRLGESFVPPLTAAIAKAKALSQSDGVKTPDEQRLVDIYDAHAAAFAEVSTRLQAWLDAGAWAAWASGRSTSSRRRRTSRTRSPPWSSTPGSAASPLGVGRRGHRQLALLGHARGGHGTHQVP
ncbi:MAG: penicillin acylase family protein [Myxococcota bacterium]